MKYYEENDPTILVSTCCGEEPIDGGKWRISICHGCKDNSTFVQLFYYNKLNGYYPDFKFEGDYTYTNSFYNVSPIPKKNVLH